MPKPVPRLNVAYLTSRPPKTADLIERDDWTEIERQYGHPLSEEIRAQISEATDRHLEFSAFADAAPRCRTRWSASKRSKRPPLPCSIYYAPGSKVTLHSKPIGSSRSS